MIDRGFHTMKCKKIVKTIPGSLPAFDWGKVSFPVSITHDDYGPIILTGMEGKGLMWIQQDSGIELYVTKDILTNNGQLVPGFEERNPVAMAELRRLTKQEVSPSTTETRYVIECSHGEFSDLRYAAYREAVHLYPLMRHEALEIVND